MTQPEGPYGSQPTPPPGYARPMDGVEPLRPDQERTWAMLSHLLSFLAAYVALGLIAPLVVLLTYGKRSAFVRMHATESLNFNITSLLVFLVCIPLMFVLIGFFVLGAWGIYYVVATILGSVRASNGEPYRYAINLRLVK